MYDPGPLHTIKSIVQDRKVLRNQNLRKSGILATLPLPSSSTMTSSPPPSKPGHSRHETALIHGLSQSEVQKLSEACVEAKSRAYCQLHPFFYAEMGHTDDAPVQARTHTSESDARSSSPMAL